MFPGTFLFASGTDNEHPKELRDKTPFPNARGVRKRSVRKEFARGTWPMFPGTSLFACTTQRDIPRNFEIKRLIQNAFSERPIISSTHPSRDVAFEN